MSEFCCLIESEWDRPQDLMPTYAAVMGKREVQMHAGVDGEDGAITPVCGRQVDPKMVRTIFGGFSRAIAIAHSVPMCPACEIVALPR